MLDVFAQLAQLIWILYMLECEVTGTRHIHSITSMTTYSHIRSHSVTSVTFSEYCYLTTIVQ